MMHYQSITDIMHSPVDINTGITCIETTYTCHSTNDTGIDMIAISNITYAPTGTLVIVITAL